jgi:hypothetical protein
MDKLTDFNLKFAVHGPDVTTDEVAASVFAAKLMQLSSAITAADKAVNGDKKVHEYVIQKLHTSTPTAVLKERPYARQGSILSHPSGMRAFKDCARAVSRGDRATALQYGFCARRIMRLASGSRRSFGYAELWMDNEIVRVDSFLAEQASQMIEPEDVVMLTAALPEPTWFSGTAHGSFDGEIKEADLRGALPEITLVLSAGGKEIGCVCRKDQIEDIRQALDKRAKVSGLAIYDGTSGLPRRIEVAEITVVKDMGDFLKWQGSFEPFEIEEWPEDDS